MDRRSFLVSLAGAAAAAEFPSRAALASHALRAGRAIARPTPGQTAWQDLEMGMFVHFAPNTWQDKEGDDLSTPLSRIDPVGLNTDQWAQCAVNMGARYLVFVAKHAGGFCMWPTRTTSYGIANTPWKGGHGDVLGEISQSAKKFGLKFGVYVSPRDDRFGAATGGKCKTPALQEEYNAMYREQLTEVLSRYGPMVEIWFDGSVVTPVRDILQRYAPRAMVFQGPQATIRWVGNEDGYAPYPCWNAISRSDAASGAATSLDSDPDGSVWLPIECDVSIRRPYWFWSTTNEKNLLSVEQMLSIYYRSVGRGAQLLMNVPANRDGLLADQDFARAKTFGEQVRRRFGNAVAQTSGHGRAISLPIPGAQRIDTVVMQEDCALGQRVRGYRLEGRSGGRWTSLGAGSSIGHKRIQPTGPATVEAVRLVVTEDAGLPAIRALAVYDTGVAPPPDWNAPTAIWSQNEVGHWNNHAFHLDLTSKIDAAAQYRLRFVPRSGHIEGIRDVALKLHGVAHSSFVKRRKGSPDSLILDIPEVGDTVTIEGRVDGAANGSILLRKFAE